MIRPRSVLAATLLWGLSALAAAQTPAPPSAPARPVVVVAEIDGIIHPISAEYVLGTIDAADTSNAALVVIVLETPGGLLDSTRTIVSRMITSRAPVAVFVGPSGARAASAGFVILMAADVAVMAPATHAGAAHPVTGSGEKMDETTSQKAASDAAAYVRSLAEARGRNVMLAEEAVLKSRAFTDREALQASPPLIDFTATSVDDLVKQLDGRTVTRFDGRSAVIKATDAEVRRVTMTRRQQFLSAIAHPQIAYLLMTLGLIGLTVELWTPGVIAPGVIGGVCLLLAFFAFQILPVNTVGLLLIALGIGLLVLELKVPGLGVLGGVGTVSLLAGSIMLTDVVPGVRVSIGVTAAAALGLATIFLVFGRMALKAQRLPSVTGVGTLIGQAGRARTAIAPDAPGQIDVRGEIWRAQSRAAIAPGQPVRVADVNGLTLIVEPLAAGPAEGDDRWKR